MMEQGRFIGWMATPPADPAVEQQLTTGKLDLAENVMFCRSCSRSMTCSNFVTATLPPRDGD